MKSALAIRDALPEEADQVSTLLKAAYQEYAASFPPGAWEGYARNIMDVRSRLGQSELIVAEQDGRFVGAVTFYPHGSSSERGGWPPGWQV